MLHTLYRNHVAANLTFVLVLTIGLLAYGLLPRQQDPDMNFNWISIITLMPGATTEDMEKQITDPLEEAIQQVAGIHFALSSSREGVSEILVRFNDMDERTFDKRVNDLRREVQNKKRELPIEAEDSLIMEITSSNSYPTVTVVVQGQEEDENLRLQARHIKQGLERIPGVDLVTPTGLHDPELQVRFTPTVLGAFGLSPAALADTLTSRLRDVSAGTLRQGQGNLLLRLQGTTADPEEIARWSIEGSQAEHTFSEVAEVARGRKKAVHAVRFQGKPAVLLAVTKQPSSNVMELTRKIRTYIEQRQTLQHQTGVAVLLANDSTFLVQHALGIMENNAVLGLLLVLLTCWLFLGSRVAVLVSLGVPFALAGTFALIYAFDGSLNIMVLLGVVIALGMLVDDAVVVVETIYDRLQRGIAVLDASVAAMREVAIPVTTSSLTTMAAFLPLMLLPGILGKFMQVIPLVVSTTLLISLVEAFWMLPAHVVAMKLDFTTRPSMLHLWRTRFLHRLRLLYMRVLLKVFRWPKISLFCTLLPTVLAVGLVAAGWLRVDFFAMDPMPLFYINVKMPPGSHLSYTIDTTTRIEEHVRQQLRPGEAHALVSYAGLMFTETQMLSGDRYGQILVSLTPDPDAHRPVRTLIDLMRPSVLAVPGPENVAFMPLSGGPPVTKPIHFQVRGDDYQQLRSAVAELKTMLARMPEVSDISDNYAEGGPELRLRLKDDALRQAGLPSATVTRLMRLLGDGDVAAHFQHQGEKIDVRVLAREGTDPLNTPVLLPNGRLTFLHHLVTTEMVHGPESIQHFNFRRAITIEAELDKERLDVVTANQRIQKTWSMLRQRYPGIELDFTGILDDIYEAMDAIGLLFLLGLGLMYLIMGTQFRSYFQPLLILTTVPMAFTGVVYGTLFSGQALSLYTLYGVVALSGIAVNASIVLIAAANDRRASGLSLLHATLYAARRRLIPVIITSVTTIAGLFSLAVGLGGYSMLWGPVATAIVWGLSFSTILTLLLMPLLYWMFMRRSVSNRGKDGLR
ncbi:MAG: efflux RND transporter permease subunit [Magnetococcales bacterium]|nr:efflux RND transporter permease subunit [Magnetococcales bacterium]